MFRPGIQEKSGDPAPYWRHEGPVDCCGAGERNSERENICFGGTEGAIHKPSAGVQGLGGACSSSGRRNRVVSDESWSQRWRSQQRRQDASRAAILRWSSDWWYSRCNNTSQQSSSSDGEKTNPSATDANSADEDPFEWYCCIPDKRYNDQVWNRDKESTRQACKPKYSGSFCNEGISHEISADCEGIQQGGSDEAEGARSKQQRLSGFSSKRCLNEAFYHHYLQCPSEHNERVPVYSTWDSNWIHDGGFQNTSTVKRPGADVSLGDSGSGCPRKQSDQDLKVIPWLQLVPGQQISHCSALLQLPKDWALERQLHFPNKVRQLRRLPHRIGLYLKPNVCQLCETQQALLNELGPEPLGEGPSLQNIQGGTCSKEAGEGDDNAHFGRGRGGPAQFAASQQTASSLSSRRNDGGGVQNGNGTTSSNGRPNGGSLRPTGGGGPGRDGVIKFLQINLQHGRAASALAVTYIQEHNIDFALISEPYVREKRMPSFLSHWICLLSTAEDAAIVIASTKGQPRLVATGLHHVTIEVTTTSGLLKITSAYAATSLDFRDALSSYQDAGIRRWDNWLLSGDLNAHCPVWGCRREDERGTLLLDYISANWLFVANDPAAGPVYGGLGTMSSPDLTLATPSVLPYIDDWKVPDDDSGSDHNYILFNIKEELVPANCRSRFKTKYGGHTRLLRHVAEHKDSMIRLIQNVDSKTSLDNCTKIIQDAIYEGCRKAYRKTKPKTVSSLQWWTPSLAIHRKLVRARRRKFQKAPADLRSSLYCQYKQERARFKKAILTAKREAWKNFCSNTDQQWGKGFQFAFRKIRSRTLTPCLDGGSYTDLLRKMFPLDPSTGESSTGTTFQLQGLSREPLITEEELELIIRNLKRNTAPGPDRLDSNIFQALLLEHLDLLLMFYRKCMEIQHFPEPLKIGEAVLIEKPGKPPGTVDSYRPICLLPDMGKILEKIITQRIENHME